MFWYDEFGISISLWLISFFNPDQPIVYIIYIIYILNQY
jgi:hypothetical protein